METTDTQTQDGATVIVVTPTKRGNPESVTKVTCKVMNKEYNTTPPQFREYAARAGISVLEAKDQYISRDGRNKIRDDKLTIDQVVESYGVSRHVLDNLNLKCFQVKPLGVRAQAKLLKEQQLAQQAVIEPATTAPSVDEDVTFDPVTIGE